MRRSGVASNGRITGWNSCFGFEVSVANTVFLGLLRWEHAGLMHSFMRVRSRPKDQGPHCKRGVFGPEEWEHAGLMLHEGEELG